ncbi:ABC transporter substrate-binding protein [Paenibacillus aceris]|uniref:ABC-type glycerol-3-phosphate transport system substrate-binding protein n=1 Tax=Paenibacillus aceris TaxID=869555 RepID=A0ABS4I693_9BACL|nr:extracellular solute-binding protein [Paenibacillus aceris]MBP1966439.1 ABC-type glycerol-3-phosphate transport system substrate-binding protein [Paenibacillus aceris]NHW39579.1 extracellular solute-binding protein [Paenibacillus aceris]
MRKTVKRVLVPGMLAISMFSVTACSTPKETASGGSENTAVSSAPVSAGDAAKPVKLRIDWWGAQTRHDLTLKVLDLYTKQHPNVTFEPEYSGWDGYWDKLATEVAAKNAPDIYQMDPAYLNQYVTNNQLAELKNTNTSNMEPSLLNTGKVNDRLYAIPLGKNINGMAYNKVLVNKLGITAPHNDWTWDEYFQFGRDAKAKLGKDSYALLDSTTNIEMADMYQISQGKGSMILDNGKFNLDKDSFIKFQTTYAQLRKEGVVPPPEVSVTNQDLDPQNDLMVKNKVLIRQLYAAQSTALDSMSPGSYAMVTVPKEKQKGGWLTPSMYWSISSNSPNKTEAEKFVDWFINSNEAGDILGTSRGVPVSSKVLDHVSPSFSAADKMGVDLLTKGAQDAPPFPFTPEKWSGWRAKDYVTATEKLMFGKSTPEQAYNELVEMSKQYQ